MHAVLDRVLGVTEEPACRCSIASGGETLAVDASACDGRLAEAPACRATVAGALDSRDVDRIRVRSQGVDRFYGGDTVAVLGAAGRFAGLVRDEDPTLADRARTDPFAATRAAAARAAPIDDIARQSGLVAAVEAADQPFQPAIAPSIADARVRTTPPEAHLRAARELESGASVRIYDVPGDGAGTYHLLPAETDLSERALATLADAHDVLAERTDEPAPVEAVRAVAGDRTDGSVRTLAAVLRKHTRGYGVLEDCFADPAVSDVYASGPAAGTPLWVVADGEQLRTNVRLGEEGAAAIASRLRRTSGQSFSRANPTIDASARIADEPVRVAGVLDPATRGHAFAFRSGGEDAFTLPGLVANGTLPADAAGLLSVAVRRSVAGLIAGTRGAGKTTILGALLWELPTPTRTVAIEDTPELPIATLQDRGRDVQPLHTTLEEGPGVTPSEALRTALRLGESAIVLGEVRGEEAGVLHEAMRVGASGEAVLGTIHGDGGADVRGRVVGDIGVSASSFAATDLVVTCEQYRTADGGRGRRVAAIEEVIAGGDTAGGGGLRSGNSRQTEVHATDVRFESLYELVGSDEATDHATEELVPTGRVDRGNSRLVHHLADPGESYAAVRDLIGDRGSFIGDLAGRATTAPGQVTTAYARRGEAA